MPPDDKEPGWRDAALLLDMKLAAADALDFISGLDEGAFLSSPLHQSAAIRKLEVLGEAANRVSVRFRALHPDIPWREMIGLRNRLIHAYDEIRLDVVWDVLTDKLPILLSVLSSLVDPETN